MQLEHQWRFSAYRKNGRKADASVAIVLRLHAAVAFLKEKNLSTSLIDTDRKLRCCWHSHLRKSVAAKRLPRTVWGAKPELIKELANSSILAA